MGFPPPIGCLARSIPCILGERGNICRKSHAGDKEMILEAMLYQIYDWQRSALEPFRLFAQAANQLYGHPDSPLSRLPGSRNVAAAFDLMQRLTQRYERPDFGIHEVESAGRLYPVHEVFEVEKPFCRL